MPHPSLRTLRTLTLPALAAVAVAACTDESTAPLATVDGGARFSSIPARTYTDTLSGTYTCSGTISVSGTVLLRGLVTFESGCNLDVAAGSNVYGEANPSAPAALLIKEGAQITAVGTSSAPIVFTSQYAVGHRNPGDWGGIVILGRSWCNGYSNSPVDCDVEGLTSALTFGRDSAVNALPNDDSGSLKFVRIEFAGRVVSADNELNALTLYAVGNGTEIEHVQVHRGSDDGIEFFGGTVNVKRVIATQNSDDSFDYSFGYRGDAQFVIVQQASNDGDKGIEADNDENTFLYRPLTRPRIYNLTMVGRATDTLPSLLDGNDAIHLRRGVGGELRNVVVVGWQGSGLDVDNKETYRNCPQIASAIFFALGGGQYDGDTDADTTATESACVTGANITAGNPRLWNPFSRTAPDFAPRIPTSASSGFTTAPAGFETASYRGAVAPSVSASGSTYSLANWYRGWTDFAPN